MRPLRLELEGFGPYRERQAVDFSDVELFAITGPTGSGKSTLLDALAFALYGRVPRVGQQVGSLVHPAASEARVRLVFAVGSRLYQVERVRGRKGEARLFELTERERLVPLETLGQLNGAVKDLLGGLSYEAFTRALLLPQGEFDRFLKGEAKERRQLLMDLFELSRLRKARERAAQKWAQLKEEKDRLEGELLSLAEATEEALEALEKELEALRQEEGRLKGEKERLEKEARAAEDLWRGLRERSLLEVQRARLLAEAKEVEGLRQRLFRAEEAARALPLWERYRRWEGALRKTEEEMAELQGRLLDLEAELQAQAFDPGALEEARRRLGEDQELKALEALWKRVAPAFAGALPEPPAARLDPGALEQILEEEASLERAQEVLRRLVEREEALRKAQEALGELERKGRAQREGVEGLKARLQGARAHRLAQVEAALFALEEEEKALREGLEALRAEERRLGVLAYRDLLRPGEPCPLCGGVVHRLPESPPLRDLERERKELEERLGRLERKRGGLLAEKETLEGLLGKTRPEPIPDDPKALEGELKEAEEKLAHLREAYKEEWGRVQALEEEVQGLKERVAQGSFTSLPEVEARLAALKGEKAALATGLRRHLLERTGGLEVEGYLKGLEDRVRELEAQQKRESLLREEIARLQSGLLGLKARKEEQTRALEEARAPLEGLLSEEEARALALSPEERRALEERIRAHERELAEVEARLEALAHLPNLSLSEAEERLRAIQKGLKELEGRLEHLAREMGAKEDRLGKMREGLKRRRALEARLAEVAREMALWEKLARDLQENNFPEYLLDLRQRDLLARADHFLAHLSGQRYRLRVQGGEYWVLDLWTEAERPVRTLSGGESFLASLSLALALSEELSRGRLGALFLDEGFGTLDPEALELVAGVLEALPTRGRLVGIVTHVAALAERLPARLVVEKRPTGSRVYWA